MTMRGEAIGSTLEVMDLLLQMFLACMGLLQERMSLWQQRGAAEERDDVERQAAMAETRRADGAMPKAFPKAAFVHSRPYRAPVPVTGKGKGGFKSKMKAKANVVAAECGAAPTNAFRFVESVLDAAEAAIDAEGTLF